MCPSIDLFRHSSAGGSNRQKDSAPTLKLSTFDFELSISPNSNYSRTYESSTRKSNHSRTYAKQGVG